MLWSLQMEKKQPSAECYFYPRPQSAIAAPVQVQEEFSILPAPSNPSAVYLRFIWEPTFIPIE